MQSEVLPLRGYSEEPIFYVYLHKRPTDGTVFYVGKGKGRRAWTTKSRNFHWQNVVNKNGGFEVEILRQGMTEQEAFNYEAEVISKYGIENLTNQTLGGISTTGMVHSEDTRKLQSEIVKKQLENDPSRDLKNRERLKQLHEKQRNDPEYKKLMSDVQKEAYARLPEEEKIRRAQTKNLWQNDPVKRNRWLTKLNKIANSPEARARMSANGKKYWDNISEEEYARRKEISKANISSPEMQRKLDEVRCRKLVLAGKYVFKSIKSFTEAINDREFDKTIGVLTKPRESAQKYGFNFYIYKGFYLEDFDIEKHASLKHWEKSDPLPKLDFDCLPKSKAVVADNGMIFLSMMEAALFCNGKTWQATADFITKNMRKGKPAMGYRWRVATNEEIAEEIHRRLEKCLKEDE